MEQRQHRPFGLADALVIIAALACTLVLLRAHVWFTRFSLRLAFWWETSRALLGARPWKLADLTRGQGVSMLVAQVIDEIFV
jgi:hypothetical protein